MRWSTNVKPKEGGTVVTQELHYQPKFGVLCRLLDAAVMNRKLDRTVADVFGGLKTYVEGTLKSGA